MKPFIKTTLLAGAIFGVVLGVSVALSIDFMMAGASEGGWYESVKHDVNLSFGPDWAEKKWFIYSGIAAVIAAIGLIGGMIGAAFGAIIGKFFSMMRSS
jgi:hypothetical protein